MFNPIFRNENHVKFGTHGRNLQRMMGSSAVLNGEGLAMVPV
jgi:hypothetical protein